MTFDPQSYGFSVSGLLSSASGVLQKLLGWRQGSDDERWSENAAVALIRKLKKTDKDGYKKLEKALNMMNPSTSCVTIPRSKDGRLQVLHRKQLPHVIACRIWRWPDLQSHREIEAEKNCSYPFNADKEDVCINPYHYRRRVDSTGTLLPPVLVQRQDEFPPMQPECQQQPSLSLIGAEYAAEYDAEYDMSTWGEILYREMDQKVGETFECKSQEVIVDGFTNPTSTVDPRCSRFCLGQLPNIHRNAKIEEVRHRIGYGTYVKEYAWKTEFSIFNCYLLKTYLLCRPYRGVQFRYVGGDVYALCQSNKPIFIQSFNLNIRRDFQPQTVLKLLFGHSLKVFDYRMFDQLLKQTVYQGGGRNEVQDLLKMATIKCSFCKGWGSGYQTREVTSTPCWIELHIMSAFQSIDQVLQEMPSPPGGTIGSNT